MTLRELKAKDNNDISELVANYYTFNKSMSKMQAYNIIIPEDLRINIGNKYLDGFIPMMVKVEMQISKSPIGIRNGEFIYENFQTTYTIPTKEEGVFLDITNDKNFEPIVKKANEIIKAYETKQEVEKNNINSENINKLDYTIPKFVNEKHYQEELEDDEMDYE